MSYAKPAVMVDLETMGTDPSAAILSIGACFFDVYGEEPLETYHQAISLESNERAHRAMSASTVLWWLSQPKDAQRAFLEASRTNLKLALGGFRRWVDGLPVPPLTLWAKDPDFDVVILRSACETVGETLPFRYHQNRSVRTAIDLAYPDSEPPSFLDGTAHSALDDALAQARLVQHCARRTLPL